MKYYMWYVNRTRSRLGKLLLKLEKSAFDLIFDIVIEFSLGAHKLWLNSILVGHELWVGFPKQGKSSLPLRELLLAIVLLLISRGRSYCVIVLLKFASTTFFPVWTVSGPSTTSKASCIYRFIFCLLGMIQRVVLVETCSSSLWFACLIICLKPILYFQWLRICLTLILTHTACVWSSHWCLF